ncbi:glutathione S-transferase alpha 4 [Cricetulus griseus]
MDSVRWALAAPGVRDGRLLFDQVPLVEIDGMPLTQSRAILSYLAAKYNLYGKDLKERLRIDMYADGTLDLMLMIAQAPFKPPKEKEESYALVVKRAKTRYFPVFEKILKDHGEDFLVGNQLSWADIQLLEAILMVEELSAPVLSDFPLLQGHHRAQPHWHHTLLHSFLILSSDEGLMNSTCSPVHVNRSPTPREVFHNRELCVTALKSRLSNLPNVKKFLQPGSQRKPPIDEKALEEAKKIFKLS